MQLLAQHAEHLHKFVNVKNYESYDPDRPRPSRKKFSPRFFEKIRAEYRDSFSSPELYKTTFVHFMLGGEAASDIGVGGNSPNLKRTGGLLNAHWESRLKAADALNHPWLQNHAKGVVCDDKRKMDARFSSSTPVGSSQNQGCFGECGQGLSFLQVSAVNKKNEILRLLQPF